MTLYVGPARSAEEVTAARELASRVFVAPKGWTEDAEYKRVLWEEPRFPGASHVVVAVTDQGALAGTIRLLPRLVRFAIGRLRVAGVSSVCVAESHRGLGVSRLLTEVTLRHARALGYEIALLFARRAVDHFYPRFDFWGLSSYSHLLIAGTMPRDLSVRRRPASVADSPRILQWHQASYGMSGGFIERTRDFLDFMLHTKRSASLTVDVVERNGIPIGYFACDGARVVELGCFPENARDLLPIILDAGGAAVSVNAFAHHPIRQVLDGLDVTISSRVCAYGGHMVCILDRAAVADRCAAEVRKMAVELSLPPRRETKDGVTVAWDGRDALVECSVPPDTPLGLAATCRLLGVKLAIGAWDSSLVPASPLNFLLLDHF